MRIAALVSLTLLFAAACGGPKESEKTGDETKSAAVEIPTGTTVDDKITAGEDPVDWKRFEVETRSPARIGIWWDNPDVAAEVTVRDMFGGAVGRAVHSKGAPKDEITADLRDGTYFIEVVAKNGKSVYTIEVMLGDQPSSSGVPRPE
jgi:hypothetical protein